MEKKILHFILLSLAIYGSEGFIMKKMELSPGDTVKGFTFIGGGTAKGINQLTSLYYISPNTAPYIEAEMTCPKLFGNHSTLINLETLEETEELIEMINSSNQKKKSSYWATSKFDKDLVEGKEQKKVKIWNEANKLFKTHFDDHDDRNERRFICELTEPIPSFVSFDLIIMVESSIKVPLEAHYTPALDFAREVAIAWFGWEQTRLAFMIFSTSSENRFRLDNGLTERQIADTITGSRHHNAEVFTHTGLEQASYLLPDCQCYDTPRTIILMTSGLHNNTAATKQVADRIKASTPEVKLLTVGIGEGMNWNEVAALASNATYAFRINEFVRLKDILRQFVTY